jgi:hypothetical protein
MGSLHARVCAPILRFGLCGPDDLKFMFEAEVLPVPKAWTVLSRNVHLLFVMRLCGLTRGMKPAGPLAACCERSPRFGCAEPLILPIMRHPLYIPPVSLSRVLWGALVQHTMHGPADVFPSDDRCVCSITYPGHQPPS